MDLVFCGTPSFAVPSLESLLSAGFNIRLVITQPDRPRGRGLELEFSPVKQCAIKHSLAVAQPPAIKSNQDLRDQLNSLRPQAIIVVGYGRIIPQWMLDLPPWGNINLHASLLPKYRGAAPIQWAIAQGETVTGVTTMRLEPGLDTGPILLQQEVEIYPEDNSTTLGARLAEMGAALMVATLRGLQSGSTVERPQDSSLATLAPILKKEDGQIDFARPAVAIHNRLRGFQPWPGAFTVFRGKKLNFWRLQPVATPILGSEFEPGRILVADRKLFAGCGGGSTLEILELQPEGKKRISAAEFISGYRPGSREKFGSQ